MADKGSAEQKGAEAPLSVARAQEQQQLTQPEQVGERQKLVRSLGRALGDDFAFAAAYLNFTESVLNFPGVAPPPSSPFVGTPVDERERRYVDDAQPTAGQARETVTRRDIFDLFEPTRRLLTRWTIGRYLREYRDPQQNTASVVTIDANATAGEGLGLLARANILSSPVVDTDKLLVSTAHVT